MGSVGQTVGGVIGGVVGAYFGGAQGATLGFSLGMAAGSFIDPPRGARQNINYKSTDVFYNTSARNMPVPIVYGVNRVGGNMLWIRVGGTNVDYDSGYKGPDGGGGSGGGSGGSKGSAKAGQTPTVDISWALALSEGEIVAVSEVFVGDKRLSYMDDISYTAYTGTPSQTADPRLTSDLGSLAPAFRHTAYMTIDATIESPNVPVINAEISGVEGTPVNEPYGGWPLGANAFAARALVQADGSFLASTHINETLYRSTDYGEHWSHVGCDINGPSGYVQTSALGDHPGVYGRAYFAMFEYLMGNVRVFTSNDFGKTWVNTSEPINQIAPQTLDASYVLGIRGNSSEVLCFTRNYWSGGGIWRSTDSALTFENVYYFSGGVYTGVSASIQPPGTDIVYGMVSGWSGASSGHTLMLKSGDRGATWETEVAPFNCVADGGWALTPNVFGFGGNNETGGVCRTTFDGGATWLTFPISEHGISAFRCNSIGILLAAGTNRVWYSTTLGRTWREMDLTTFGQPTIIPLYLTSMWFTNEQVCFGSGVPASVTCLWMTVPTSCGNPALIVRDLLTNTRYGKGLDRALRINEDSFRSASNYCIAQVPSRLSSGHLEQRFCLDYVVDAQQPIVDHLRDMLATFGGYLCWSQGDVKLKIDMPTSCCQSFGMNEIVANTFQWKKQSLRERPNIIRVDYVEPGNTVIDATGETLNSDQGRFIGSIDADQTVHVVTASNYKTYQHDFVESSDPWDIERTGERRERTLNLTGIKRRSQAQRMAEYYLAKTLYCQHICGFRVGINALRSEVGDVIAVSHDVPGWYGKQFRIMEIQEAENDEMQLGCIEYNENVYRATAGAVPGQEPIVGRRPPDWTAAPYHVGRLTAYERPNEDSIEINYTRIMTSDLFGGVTIYRRIGEDGAWQLVGTQLSTAPTAYLASHVETITLVES